MRSLSFLPYNTALNLHLTIYDSGLPVFSRMIQKRSLKCSQLVTGCRRQTLLTCG